MVKVTKRGRVSRNTRQLFSPFFIYFECRCVKISQSNVVAGNVLQGVPVYSPSPGIPLHPFTDEELIDQIAGGNSAAFAQLYHRYKHTLFAFCIRLLKDRDDAMDAVQETFVKIHNRLSSLHDPASFRAWMFAIVRNEAYAILRRKNNLEGLDGEAEDVWEEGTPLDLMIGKEKAEIVQQFLETLKPEYREVLLWREYEQLSYAEIAAVTGDTESSVKSRLFKARKALTKKFMPYVAERKEP